MGANFGDVKGSKGSAISISKGWGTSGSSVKRDSAVSTCGRRLGGFGSGIFDASVCNIVVVLVDTIAIPARTIFLLLLLSKAYNILTKADV